ncbi:tol-pal system-associated acyl-CoA thioesterase [Xenophilus arseniciresistens]|uniref:Tol-pal system-associated acyl-CoA thioesterase n=1 Tax=Xenophilus arseniciresistens TaxID=1283306 RepID=A0AAE3T0C3_9BURK|nr:tol-pal system-associated acyl-CoA thioesterase [Xenophilus arseniciresistens]MDA7417964.1 tol-pal system-associated acyl-CoA thioesterase [Xenophilus arseniciresistens]
MRQAAPQAEGQPFELQLRVYWEDTDAGGIVFYANYLKYMERARTEWLRALGVHQRELREQTGGMFVVSEAQLKYHRPARLDDVLCITTQLQHLGTASIVMLQAAYRLDPAAEAGRQLLCEGTIRIGWVDAQRMRPTRIPDTVTGTLKAVPGSITVANGPGLASGLSAFPREPLS